MNPTIARFAVRVFIRVPSSVILVFLLSPVPTQFGEPVSFSAEELISLYPECECTSPKRRFGPYLAESRKEACFLVLQRPRQPVARRIAFELVQNENPRHLSSFLPRFHARPNHDTKRSFSCIGSPPNRLPTVRIQGRRWPLRELQSRGALRVAFET